MPYCSSGRSVVGATYMPREVSEPYVNLTNVAWTHFYYVIFGSLPPFINDSDHLFRIYSKVQLLVPLGESNVRRLI